ncbi:MAG: hypothetical protein U0L92_06680 [Clostridia bacterium]|nr:hypothetical protein [Clostridia bacterium]
MGKFSAGLLAGAMLGVGMLMADKKTIKRMKKMAHHIPCYFHL